MLADIRLASNIALDIPAGLEYFHAGRGSPHDSWRDLAAVHDARRMR